MIALQHQVLAFDAAATAERGLQGLEPRFEIGRGEAELFNHRGFFTATTRALHADHGSCRSSVQGPVSRVRLRDSGP